MSGFMGEWLPGETTAQYIKRRSTDPRDAVVAAAAKLLAVWEPRDGDADGYAEREELRLALEALAKENS